MADRPPRDAIPRRPPPVAIPAPDPIPPGLAAAPLPFPPGMAAPPPLSPPPPGAEAPPLANGAPAAEKPRVRGRPFQPGNPGGGRRKKSAAWKAEMKRGSDWAPRILYMLMMNGKTPSEVRRKAAEFFIVWMHGRPVAALSNPDGSPLFPPGAPADNPVTALLRRLAARRSDAGAPGPQDTTPADNAPPGADGEAPGAA